MVNYVQSKLMGKGKMGYRFIFTSLKRRPSCRIEDISRGLVIEKGELMRHIPVLVKRGFMEEDIQEGEAYFRIKERL